MEHIFDPDATRAEFDAERSRALAEARQDAKQSATEATLQAGRRQRIMGLMQDGDLSASDWKVQDAALERRSTRPLGALRSPSPGRGSGGPGRRRLRRLERATRQRRRID
jgi:hypothetical protein